MQKCMTNYDDDFTNGDFTYPEDGSLSKNMNRDRVRKEIATGVVVECFADSMV